MAYKTYNRGTKVVKYSNNQQGKQQKSLFQQKMSAKNHFFAM